MVVLSLVLYCTDPFAYETENVQHAKMEIGPLVANAMRVLSDFAENQPSTSAAPPSSQIPSPHEKKKRKKSSPGRLSYQVNNVLLLRRV